MTGRGALSIVLHTHMPYVEGYGTWPFGEEWLWEAVATSYVPLLDVLDAAPGRITLSLTPVLLDQLEAPGARDRLMAFLRDLRPLSHRLDIEAAGDAREREALELSAAVYARAAQRLEEVRLAACLARHATWTSSATHAVLPLMATDAGVRLQVRTGVESWRARASGRWDGGFWLPECAYAPWLEPLLAEAGVRSVCVDLTDVLGRGTEDQLQPLEGPGGVTLVPIDREAIELVWSDGGYPAKAAYKSSRSMTEHRHLAWANDGAPYDAQRAYDQARADAEAFVGWAEQRVAGGGMCVFAVDTELLGHWWPDGITWLQCVVESCERRGVPLLGLDEALEDRSRARLPRELPVTSWGTPRDLQTWAGPATAWLAREQRAAELAVLARRGEAGTRALRELLALQASDWAFLLHRDTAGPYPVERARGHLGELRDALGGAGAGDGPVRNLAPHLQPAALSAP